MRVQLAIQGGGAKLMPLLAALEAVQELENSEAHLQVTRVAGTSAGAIAGAIFAAGVPMAAARAIFQKHFDGKINRHFPPPSAWMYTNLVRGRQFWSTEPLSIALKEIFRGANATNFEHLRIPVIAIASDLVNSSSKEFFSGDIVEALLHSCALPYCFRVWNGKGNHNPVLVDGGICENLPSDVLEQFEAKDGPVVALSFRDGPASVPPGNIRQFSLALLDTAITNSMNRAKLRLGKERIHEIRTPLRTFDFEQALKMDAYAIDPIKADTKHFFNNFAVTRHDPANSAKEHRIDPSLWEQQNVTMMETLGRIYQGQHAASRKHYEKCLVEAIVYSFENQPDEVHYRAVYRTTEDAMFCQGFAASQPGSSLLGSSFSMVDEKQNPVRIEVMPFRDPQRPGGDRVLTFFVPPLRPNSGPYTLDVNQRIQGFMRPLVDQAVDEIKFTAHRGASAVREIDLIVHLPEKFKNARMEGKPGSEGRPLTEGELRISYPPRFGFRTIGWRGQDRSPDVEFAANIYRE